MWGAESSEIFYYFLFLRSTETGERVSMDAVADPGAGEAGGVEDECCLVKWWLDLSDRDQGIYARSANRRFRGPNGKWKESPASAMIIVIWIGMFLVVGYSFMVPLIASTTLRITVGVVMGGSAAVSIFFLYITHNVDPGVVLPRRDRDPCVVAAEAKEAAKTNTAVATDVKQESPVAGGDDDELGTGERRGLVEEDTSVLDGTALPPLRNMKPSAELVHIGRAIEQSGGDSSGVSGTADLKSGSASGDRASGDLEQKGGADSVDDVEVADDYDPEYGMSRANWERGKKGGLTWKSDIWRENKQWTRFMPVGDTKYVRRERYCRTCNIWKRPGTSHCDICGYCMSSMDHHCPAVGTCVAARNHRFFVAFLLAAGAASVAFTVGTIFVFTRRDIEQWQRSLAIVLMVPSSFNLIFALFGLTHCGMLLCGQTTRSNIKGTQGDIECGAGHLAKVCCGPITWKYGVPIFDEKDRALEPMSADSATVAGGA